MHNCTKKLSSQISLNWRNDRQVIGVQWQLMASSGACASAVKARLLVCLNTVTKQKMKMKWKKFSVKK